MNGINVGSLLAGVIAIGSAASVATGHPALAAAISNPVVATSLTAIVGGIASLWSMFAPALFHSTTTSAAAAIEAKK